MKVGIIGPNDVVEKVHRVIKEENRETEIVNLVYQHYFEAPRLVIDNQDKLDGIIFAGKTPYTNSANEVKQEIPWEYLGRRGSTLLRALLEVSYMKQCDIRNLSVDTYTDGLLKEAFDELKTPYDNAYIYIAEQRLLDRGYHDYLMDFHVENYFKKSVSCCITGFSEIEKRLKEKGVPVVKTTSTATIIAMIYNQLELRYLASKNQNSQIVVVSLFIDFPSYYQADSNDEFAFLMNRNKLMEKLFSFASKIEAAIIERGNREFMIFTTKERLETETNDYNNMQIFETLREAEVTNISVGIGYGQTVQAAKNNALIGMSKAEKEHGSIAYTIYSRENIRGPIALEERKNVEKIDEKLLVISRNTGVSTNTLHRIIGIVKYTKNNTTTSKELASACDMSKRNMDRILQRMEQEGYCEVVGERIVGCHGRPSRIIKFTMAL